MSENFFKGLKNAYRFATGAQDAQKDQQVTGNDTKTDLEVP